MNNSHPYHNLAPMSSSAASLLSSAAANSRHISNQSHPHHHHLQQQQQQQHHHHQQQQQQNSNNKVSFEKLAFYEYIYEISAPTRLQGINPTQRPLSFYFNFFLNIEQCNQIVETREMINGKFEFGKQIHVRFGYFDSSALQEDTLPLNLLLSVNGKPAQLPVSKNNTYIFNQNQTSID